MRLVTCLLFALASGFAGLSLRAALPVTPVDASFREVIRRYAPQGQGDGQAPSSNMPSSNMPETSAP